MEKKKKTLPSQGNKLRTCPEKKLKGGISHFQHLIDVQIKPPNLNQHTWWLEVDTRKTGKNKPSIASAVSNTVKPNIAFIVPKIDQSDLQFLTGKKSPIV